MCQKDKYFIKKNPSDMTDSSYSVVIFSWKKLVSKLEAIGSVQLWIKQLFSFAFFLYLFLLHQWMWIQFALQILIHLKVPLLVLLGHTKMNGSRKLTYHKWNQAGTNIKISYLIPHDICLSIRCFQLFERIKKATVFLVVILNSASWIRKLT